MAFKHSLESLPAPQLGQLNPASAAQALTPEKPSLKTNLASKSMTRMSAISSRRLAKSSEVTGRAFELCTQALHVQWGGDGRN
jgi:hypothetical protein